MRALWQHRRQAAVLVLGVVTCVVVVLAKASLADIPRSSPAAGAVDKPRAENVFEALDPRRHREEAGRLVSPLAAGRKAILTLDPGLQRHLERELSRHAVPYGAAVVVEPSTGRVLAYVSHSSANPEAADLVLDVTPPAASVFKIVTGAALLDRGVAPSTRVCYGGGHSRLLASDIVDDPRRDNVCSSLSDAMGGSLNAVFAKLASRHLDPATLERYASAFGFGTALPFDVSTVPSPAEVPREPLEFARTAAGFWHMHMSPLHGALIAATIANDGVMPRPFVVEQIEDAKGRVVYRGQPRQIRRVVSRRTARLSAAMMARTVTDGTARAAFHDKRGLAYVPVPVAGKTGTLSSNEPYRGYTWWVGFAPIEAPRVAVATLIVNTPLWRIKASYLAREALRAHFSSTQARR